VHTKVPFKANPLLHTIDFVSKLQRKVSVQPRWKASLVLRCILFLPLRDQVSTLALLRLILFAAAYCWLYLNK
jgi:hypothetical protein